MLKALLNTELNDLPIRGLDIHTIKKYVVRTTPGEPFLVCNFALLLIKSGTLKIQLKGIIQDVSARDLLVIPSNTYCKVLGAHEHLQLYVISFNREFLLTNGIRRELADSFCFFIGKVPVKIGLIKKEYLLLALIYKLIYFIHQDLRENGADLALQGISFNLFLHEIRLIYAKYTCEIAPKCTRKEILTLKFLTILTLHCKKQHSAKFYAEKLFVTPGHLNKIVKQVTGETVKKIIEVYIVREAENLLDNPELTISEIADELEFSTANGFSLFFKKHNGISPSEYRLKKAI